MCTSPSEVTQSAIPREIPLCTMKPVLHGHLAHSWTYSYDVEDICLLMADLVVPWASAKWLPFAFTTVYVGFLWDLWNQ
jgi:hypothetical protein